MELFELVVNILFLNINLKVFLVARLLGTVTIFFLQN